MSSEALTVPCCSEPATRNKSSQFRTISSVFTRDRAMAIQDPIVGRGIETPEAGFSDVRQPGAELVAQQPEQAEDHVTDPSRVGHDLHRAQLRLVLQQAIEDEHRIAQRAGDDDSVEAGELVRA